MENATTRIPRTSWRNKDRVDYIKAALGFAQGSVAQLSDIGNLCFTGEVHMKPDWHWSLDIKWSLDWRGYNENAREAIVDELQRRNITERPDGRECSKIAAAATRAMNIKVQRAWSGKPLRAMTAFALDQTRLALRANRRVEAARMTNFQFSLEPSGPICAHFVVEVWDDVPTCITENHKCDVRPGGLA